VKPDRSLVNSGMGGSQSKTAWKINDARHRDAGQEKVEEEWQKK